MQDTGSTTLSHNININTTSNTLLHNPTILLFSYFCVLSVVFQLPFHPGLHTAYILTCYYQYFYSRHHLNNLSSSATSYIEKKAFTFLWWCYYRCTRTYIHTTVRVLSVHSSKIINIGHGDGRPQTLFCAAVVFERLEQEVRDQIESRAPSTTAQPHPSWQI